MDKLEADNVNDGRVRDDDFLAELAIPFREESGRPFSCELKIKQPKYVSTLATTDGARKKGLQTTGR